MQASAKTRYAKSGDADIAYQVLGAGPIDLLVYNGTGIPIDCVDEEPSMARFHRHLATFSRLIRFDPRGFGLSDRGSTSSPPTHEQWADDALAVLDSVGCERAAVFAPFVNTAQGVILAAMHQERVSHLAVVNGAARVTWAPDYPAGIPAEYLDAFPDMTVNPDAQEQGHDILAVLAPSVANDNAFRTWWDRSGNRGATPAMARELLRASFQYDVRDLLRRINVPTLVIHRKELRSGGEHGRYLAEHIPAARYVELPGADALYWVGDTGPMLDEIEELVTGVRGGSGAERVLATVLFTDMVGSTKRAAQLGDVRWRDLLDRHDQSVRIQLGRFRGREVDTAGDGFLITFDSPRRAIECALAIRDALRTFDVEIRAGIHTGEIERRGDDVAGMAVHIGARVSALAGPDEVLVSSAVPPLVAGSDIEFEDRGEHDLKGVPGAWRLYAVRG